MPIITTGNGPKMLVSNAGTKPLVHSKPMSNEPRTTNRVVCAGCNKAVTKNTIMSHQNCGANY